MLFTENHPPQNAEDAPVTNGEMNGDSHDEDGPNKSDIIVITGKAANCEQARLALLVS